MIVHNTLFREGTKYQLIPYLFIMNKHAIYKCVSQLSLKKKKFTNLDWPY